MTNAARDGGVVFEWIGGNCPVQAEGTFDGVPFYFRARGTSVTCEVGTEFWCWDGPVYDWPHAGWISEDTARAYIDTAYHEWRRGGYMERIAETRRKNAERNATLKAAIAAYETRAPNPNSDSQGTPWGGQP